MGKPAKRKAQVDDDDEAYTPKRTVRRRNSRSTERSYLDDSEPGEDVGRTESQAMLDVVRAFSSAKKTKKDSFQKGFKRTVEDEKGELEGRIGVLDRELLGADAEITTLIRTTVAEELAHPVLDDESALLLAAATKAKGKGKSKERPEATSTSTIGSSPRPTLKGHPLHLVTETLVRDSHRLLETYASLNATSVSLIEKMAQHNDDAAAATREKEKVARMMGLGKEIAMRRVEREFWGEERKEEDEKRHRIAGEDDEEEEESGSDEEGEQESREEMKQAKDWFGAREREKEEQDGEEERMSLGDVLRGIEKGVRKITQVLPVEGEGNAQKNE
ncbi:hypothetical protein K402DRAFT_459264 [Aulographum hederae CBS 113979]|uniref:Uncharacterized protein n=1 Tax=Aulographum hederae CBS 113979 TaxID=1176131 RepID=A0A6G1HFY8_9PEZI|nr:hypothetical protein K402DRAFT_459264 [Aulographum hederae CBS 113979]